MANDNHNNILISCFLRILWKRVWSIPVLCVFLFTLQNAGIAFSSPGDDWENVTIIPRNGREFEQFTRHLNCSEKGLKAMYLLHSIHNITILGCAEEKLIDSDYCPEINSKGAQPKYNAPRTPKDTNSFYYASDSYLMWSCFEKYGGILSPKEREEEFENLKKKYRDLNPTNICPKENIDMSSEIIEYFLFIIMIMIRIFLLIIFGFFILFLIRKCVYKSKISPTDFIRETYQLLKRCFVQIAMGTSPQINIKMEEVRQTPLQYPGTVTLDGDGESQTIPLNIGGTRN